MVSTEEHEAGSGADGRPATGNPVFTHVVILVILGLLLVVLGANSMGALTASPRFEIGEFDRQEPTIQSPRATDPGAGVAGEGPQESSPSSLPSVLLITTAAVLILGVALMVQSAVRIRYSDRKAPHEQERPDGDIVPRIKDADLTSFQQHFDDAEATLLQDGASSDAIVKCWLALERAASLAGRGRRASETPSEFTAVVLGAFDTNPADIALVLRLYHRARYGVRAQRAAMSERELAEVRRALLILRHDIEKDLPMQRSS